MPSWTEGARDEWLVADSQKISKNANKTHSD